MDGVMRVYVTERTNLIRDSRRNGSVYKDLKDR